jgi:zinc protease
MVLAIVGDVDPDRVTAKFRDLFAGEKRASSTKPLTVAPEPARHAPEQNFEHVKKEQAHIAIGYPGTTLKKKDRYALEVLASILSGQGGRLFIELRDRQGLAYNVGALSQEGLEPGYFLVYIATSPEKVQQALKAIDAEIKRLREEPVSRAELERVQRSIVGSFDISLQRKSTLASYLAFNERYGLGYNEYTRFSSSILAVTTQDIQSVARKYLKKESKVIAIVMPETLSPGARKKLGNDRRAGVIRSSEAKPSAKSRKKRRRARSRR